MRTLEIDIETFSSVSLQKCGVYKYAESPDFQIILFGYSVDGGEVKVVDLLEGCAESTFDESHAANPRTDDQQGKTGDPHEHQTADQQQREARMSRSAHEDVRELPLQRHHRGIGRVQLA